MQIRSLELRLKGFGAGATTAQVELESLSRVDRLRRAAIIMGISLVVAVVAIPIPLVHLVLVPGALVLGTIFALIKLNHQEVFRTARGRCPFCSTEQSFMVMGRFRLPKKLHCVSCQRELMLEGPTTAPPRYPT